VLPRSPSDPQAVEVDLAVDCSRGQAQVAKVRLVLGLAEDGDGPRQEARPGIVEVVAVQVRDQDGIDVCRPCSRPP
jgi:hypothetical protein